MPTFLKRKFFISGVRVRDLLEYATAISKLSKHIPFRSNGISNWKMT